MGPSPCDSAAKPFFCSFTLINIICLHTQPVQKNSKIFSHALFSAFYSILLILGTSFKVEFKGFAPHCILFLVTFHAAFKLQLSASLIFGPLISITHCTNTEKCNEERRKRLHDTKLFLDKWHIIWKQAHQVSGMGATATFCFASVIASWFQRSQLKESRMNI